MEIADWKKLFAPHILSRGEEYYESELVEIEAMDEQSIEATVEGTDTYSVEIVLKNNRVAEMACDCPYAADGNNCKHMAAVLFAADDTEGTEYPLIEYLAKLDQEKREARDSALTKAISGLSEEQLRLLLTDAAIKFSKKSLNSQTGWNTLAGQAGGSRPQQRTSPGSATLDAACFGLMAV